MKTVEFIMVLSLGLVSLAAIDTTSSYAVQVDGYCYLENQPMHDGTKVLFLAVSPWAQTDSTYTDSAGYYAINLAQGAYDVHFTHFAYFGQEFLNQSFYSATTMPSVTLVYMGGIPISGALSGVLEGIIYIVVGDISVASGDSLIINPGANLLFDGNFDFSINGYLYAVGTEIDSIYFQPNHGIQFWGGINFWWSSSDSSCMCYCEIKGSSTSGIRIDQSDITISHCSIHDNFPQGTSGGGISCGNGAEPIITYCNIYNNHLMAGGGGGGINCNNSSPLISHCLIRNNSSNFGAGGIYCDDSNAIITNCTFYGNSGGDGGGISCHFSDPIVLNTILWGDSVSHANNEIYISTGSAPEITYCDIQGGWTGIGNINADPLFVDPTNGNFQLESNSHCIDAGDPNSPLDPDGTRADMGAFFYDHYLPYISVSANVLDFGEVSIGEQGNLPLFIYNRGTAPLILYGITIMETVFSTNYDPSDSLIQSGDSLQVIVYFAPQDTIEYEDFLSINNNHIPLDVRLVGVGIPPGGIRDRSPITIPKVYALFPAYPNPFNPLTTLSFSVPISSVVSLKVFNVTSRQVATLLNGWQEAGIHKVTFDGSELASGIYFCQMTAGKFSGVVKMVLLK